MGLETFTYITSLNTANPVAGDQVSQGDDHLRGIKTAVQDSFPNINAAVTADPTELNYLDGVTGTTGTGKLVLDTAPTLGVVTVTSIGGITEANLVDKSDTEAITGTWTFTDLDGVASSDLVDKSAAETITGTWTFTAIAGAGGSLDFGSTSITSDNDTADEPGYKGTPQNIQNGSYTLVLGDAGKQIYKASGGAGETITIPANSSVAFPVGTIIVIVNDGGGDLSIAITTDTLESYGGSTGTKTLSDNNKAVIEKVATTVWKYQATDA